MKAGPPRTSLEASVIGADDRGRVATVASLVISRGRIGRWWQRSVVAHFLSPGESRGSRRDLGAAEGAVPSADSTAPNMPAYRRARSSLAWPTTAARKRALCSWPREIGSASARPTAQHG